MEKNAKLDCIFDSTLKIEECVQSLKCIIKDIVEVETEASKCSDDSYCGMANIVVLIADKIDSEVGVIMSLCDPASGRQTVGQ